MELVPIILLILNLGWGDNSLYLRRAVILNVFSFVVIHQMENEKCRSEIVHDGELSI